MYSGRGDADAVITTGAVDRTDAWMLRFTTPHRQVYAGLGHGISRTMAADVASFLSRVARPAD